MKSLNEAINENLNESKSLEDRVLNALGVKSKNELYADVCTDELEIGVKKDINPKNKKNPYMNLENCIMITSNEKLPDFAKKKSLPFQKDKNELFVFAKTLDKISSIIK